MRLMADAVTPAFFSRTNASTWQPALRRSSAVIPSGNPAVRAISFSAKPAPFNSPSE